MSNTRLQSPLWSFVNVESPTLRNPPRLPVSHAQIINLVDDDVDTNASPPAQRRRLDDSTDDDIVVTEWRINANNNVDRRVSAGGIDRPIVIPDSDEEHSPIRDANAHAHAEPSTQRHRRDAYRIFSPPPPPRTYHRIPPVPSLPIIANPQPFAILTPPQGPEDNTNPRRRLPFDEPPQPSASSSAADTSRRANGIQLGGGIVTQSIRARRGPTAQNNNDASRNGVDPVAARIVTTYLHNPQHQHYQHHQHQHQQQHQQQHQHQQQYQHQHQQHLHHHHHHHHPHPHQHQHRHNLFRTLEGAAGAWIHPNFVWEAAALYFSQNGRANHAAGGDGIASVPEYTKDMTHPGVPPPGWSFSFGTSIDLESDLAGTANGSPPAEYLACAMCLDPLHANVDERGDLTPEERKHKRVWALRCGHMFDGKCIENLMVPSWQKEKPKVEVVEVEEKKEEVDKEVGGVHVHVEEVDFSKNNADVSASEHITEESKEKEKEKEKEKDDDEVMVLSAPAVSEPSTSTALNDTPPSTQPESTSASTSTSTSTTPGGRYNLRTRRPPQEPSNGNGKAISSTSRPKRASRAANATARGGVAATAAAAEEPSTSSRRNRGTKRKHDGKAVKTEPAKPDKAIRYYWTCPVAGCAKMHGSYKVQDLWKPDEEDGPIAIYI